MTIPALALAIPPLIFGAFILYLVATSLIPHQFRHPVRSLGGISVIVPFRDEATNLPHFLATIGKQHTTLPWEVILIDDASNDDSRTVIERWHADNRSLSLTVCAADKKEGISSKQAALDTGVARARYDWIVFTDADMIFSPEWLEHLARPAQCGADVVFGRTGIHRPGKSPFAWFQHYQLTFLFCVAWVFHRAHLPGSCMGNNLLFKKALYTAIGGHQSIGFSLTEDARLFQEFQKKGYAVGATHPFAVTATTPPAPTLRSWYNQSIRWARGGFTTPLFLPGMLTVLHSLGLLFAGIFVRELLPWYIASTCCVQILFTTLFCRFSPPLFSLFFPLYFLVLHLQGVLFCIPALMRSPVHWKGRVLHT